MSRTVRIRVLIAALIVATAITAGMLFYGEQVPGQMPIVIIGGVVVLAIAVLLITSSARRPGTNTTRRS